MFLCSGCLSSLVVASSRVVLEGVETRNQDFADLLTGVLTGTIGGAGLTLLMLGIENLTFETP